MSTIRSTYTTRYRQLVGQAAYRRRIAARGLPAILEPYTRRGRAPIPTQRAARRRTRTTV